MLLHQLHWLPVQQRITYKLAVLTYKVRSTSTPVYLHRRIAECACSRTLHSATIPLLDKPFMRTYFSRCAFRSSAPTVWNSLPQTVLISDSLFQTLKLFGSIRLSLNTDLTCCQRLWSYDRMALEKFDYYYYYYYYVHSGVLLCCKLHLLCRLLIVKSSTVTWQCHVLFKHYTYSPVHLLEITWSALCGLRGCKNRPAPFPGRMSHKATKPGYFCFVS